MVPSKHDEQLRERFAALFPMQDALNKAFDSEDWAKKKHPWAYYIRHEASEAIGHHNEVFHYRGDAPNRKKIETELVDILHFLIAWMLEENFQPAFLYDLQAPLPPEPGPIFSNDERRAHDYEEELAKACIKKDLALTEKRFYLFVARLGFSMLHLINQYQLKYTLNQFRIDNGYLQGTYVKQWADGDKGFIEDNDFLNRLAEENRTADGYDLSAIRSGLIKQYSLVR